ncbi:MAG: TonB-dependent receptor [Deltaproteobacteria bacterium]|jgi:vitamin B12 transporter|nr:TonB-dependent receptor [Deltaproteobacteria bacterium]
MGKFVHVLTVFIVLFCISVCQAIAQDGNLDTIVVTGSRMEEQLKSVSGSMTVITEQDIAKSGAKELGTLLIQKGFNIIRNGHEMKIQIRGIADDQTAVGIQTSRVLILVNGRTVGLNIANLVGLDNVDHIEIVRGPSAIQYGPAAMGGVINIITKRGRQDEFHVSVESGIGSFDYYKEHFALSGGYKGIDYAGSITYTSRGDYKVYGGRLWPKTAESDNTNMNLELGYTFFDTHRIGLSLLRSNVHTGMYFRGNNGGFERAYYDYMHGVPISDDGYYDYVTNNTGFVYDGATQSGMLDWSVGYSFGSYNRKYFFGDTKIKNRQFQGNIGYNSAYIDLDLGFDSVRYALVDESNTGVIQRYVSTDLGIYITAKIKLLDDSLFITLGGRHDRYKLHQLSGDVSTRVKSNFAPSFGIAYLPKPWLKLRANYAKGFKVPTSEQLNGGAWNDPNPALKPEQSETIEFGADVSLGYLNSSLTYFNTNWINRIEGGSNNNPPNYYWFRNIQKAQISGLEFSFDIDFGQIMKWDFVLQPRIGLTYYFKRLNKDTGSPTRMMDGSYTYQLSNIPKYTLSYGLTFNYPKIDLTMDLNGVYIGETATRDTRPTAPIVGRTIHYTHGTTSVDLTIEKGLVDFGENRGRLSLRLELNNMFDDKNQTYLDFPGPGRNFYVALKYSL